VQKGRGFKLGQQKNQDKTQEINGGQKDSKGTSFKKVVQGELGGCSLWEALRQTQGRKARNAILQTIEACKLKNPCHCWRVDLRRKAFKDISKEKTRATSWKTQKGKVS